MFSTIFSMSYPTDMDGLVITCTRSEKHPVSRNNCGYARTQNSEALFGYKGP